MNKSKLALLKFGAIQTLFMAIYHFFIPFQFQWGNYLLEHSPTINWSLYSLNNYFSFNLLILSLFLMYFVRSSKTNIQLVTVLSLLMLFFWIFSFAYQIIDPMPLPNRLRWLGIVLPSIALFNAILFGLGLKKLHQNKKDNSSSKNNS